jgi:ribosomal protein S4
LKVKSDGAFKVYLTEIENQNKTFQVPAWIGKLENGGKVDAEPTRDQIDQSIKERLIVELYSR